MSGKNIQLKMLLSLALGTEIFYLIIAAVDDLRHNVPLYLFCYAVIFIFYLLGLILFWEGPRRRLKNMTRLRRFRWVQACLEGEISIRELLTASIIFAAIFRLTLILTTPTLSDDIYRYVWDGKVASEGINPYQYSPDSDELTPLRDEVIYPNINHKEISTIYPPTTQLVFLALYQFDPSIVAYKAAFVGLDILTLVMLMLILKHLGLNLRRALIYAWNPLIIIEISGNGHSESLGIFLLTFSLWILLQKRLLVSTFVLALSFLTKFITVLFLPFIILFKKENRFGLPLLFIIFSALLYLPYADAGKQLFSGLLVYTDKWRFNDSLFYLILKAVQKFITQDVDMSLMLSKRIVAVVFAGLAIYYLARFRKDIQSRGEIWFFKLGLILIGAFILLSPTVHPWYICWVLPFLAIVPNRAWLMLTGLVGLSYWILIEYTKTGVWQQSNIIRWLEYAPFYAVLVYDVVKSKFFSKMQPARVSPSNT